MTHTEISLVKTQNEKIFIVKSKLLVEHKSNIFDKSCESLRGGSNEALSTTRWQYQSQV